MTQLVNSKRQAMQTDGIKVNSIVPLQALVGSWAGKQSKLSQLTVKRREVV